MKSTNILEAREGDRERLAVLEVRVNDHEEDIKRLIQNYEALALTVTNISGHLQQIKWTVVGGLIVFFATNKELLGLIKLLPL